MKLSRYLYGPLHASLSILLLVACGGGPDAVVKGGDKDPGEAGAPGTGGTGGTAGSGGTRIIDTPDAGEGGEGGGGQDPCAVPNPPRECFEIKPSGPACGDGEINQESERCDDGNSLPGDGCSGVCAVEPYWDCSEPGQPCVTTIACGDGAVDPGEFCDDGNLRDGDGCSDECQTMDPGYACRVDGEPCIKIHDCGDGRVNGS